MKALFKRLCRDIAGVLVFLVVARQVGMLLTPPELFPFGSVIVVNLVSIPRMGAALSRFMLAPAEPGLRLLNANDDTAGYLHRHNVGLLLLASLSMMLVKFNDMNGVMAGESRLGFWLTLAVVFYVIAIIWRARHGLVGMMRGAGSDVSPSEAWVARAYPWFGIAVTVFTWLLVIILASLEMFALLKTAPHYKMMILLLLAPLFDTAVRGLVRHLAPPMTGEGQIAAAAYLSTKRSYTRIGRLIVFGLVIITIAKVWGIDFANLAAAGVGVQFPAKMIEIFIILAAGYLAWELVSLWINRKLAAEQTALGFNLNEEEPGGGEGGGAGGSRLSTVLPLLLGVAKAAIAVIFSLVALGNIGIDITPLLAGAGIVGLAVGFGAQKLLADVVGGIFFLIDDAFRTGEFVEVEGTVGSVEKISIRSMQLRHHKGPVHTIPYGEIPKITNYSRDWVIMKLKFTVPFETDPNKVKKIGADMLAEEE
ncbi:MAG: mechanosensitive ion channel family protein, partial [Alphaproteobacteria bacterium]